MILPRTIEYGWDNRIRQTSGMVRRRAASGAHYDEIEAGVYIHRDDLARYIRHLAANGGPDLPPLASAVPDWIASKVERLG